MSVQWVWPSKTPYDEREKALMRFTTILGRAWADAGFCGHSIEIGHAFTSFVLDEVLSRFNQERGDAESLPYLAGLVCSSPYDLALHDAYASAHERPVFDVFTEDFMNRDLSSYFDGSVDGHAAAHGPKSQSNIGFFRHKYPGDFLTRSPSTSIRAWHLVGGKDTIKEQDLVDPAPDDGYPTLLAQWIASDGLRCLKVKLTGNDYDWDYQRMVEVGRVGADTGVEWLSADFNCQVSDPAYVNSILDQLRDDYARLFGMVLYVEQPFPYDLSAHPIDVHSVSSRKPLFLDESAHDWRVVAAGFELGWNGVALKTCKTLTGALLSLCWARACGMAVMVQDLTNPMLAQIPHLQLGFFSGTIMGVETNSMQFYPAASLPEAAVHPGLFTRREGMVDLSSCLGRPGFGYRVTEIERKLPAPAGKWEA